MKRIVSAILVFVILILATSCTAFPQIVTETEVTTVAKKEVEYEAASVAYQDLIKAHELCVDVMDSVYGAWYFSIYEYDDYSGSTGFSKFCSKANISSTDALKAAETLLKMDDISAYAAYGVLIEDFSWSILIVTQVYKINGIFDEIEECLANAKASLKSVTNEYSDYTGYSVLKSYYSEISAYYEFSQSPTGSFAQLKTTIDNYETNLRNYKNDLSFIFD